MAASTDSALTPQHLYMSQVTPLGVIDRHPVQQLQTPEGVLYIVLGV